MKKNVLLLSLFFSLTALGQARNSAKSKDFPLPLHFDVVGHGLELAPLKLQYDLESSKGDELQMGRLIISPETVRADLRPANRLDSNLTRVIQPDRLNDWVFTFQWPENLMSEGVLEVISRTGRVLWSVNIDSRAQDNWRNQLEAWAADLTRAKLSKETIASLPVFKIQYGLRNAGSGNTPFWNLQEPFRFCLSHQEDGAQERVCTAQFEIQRQKNWLRLAPVPLVDAPSRVIALNKAGRLKDEIPVKIGKSVQFYAELTSGMSYEFVATPRATHVVDMVQDRSGSFAWMTLESEEPPLVPATLLNKSKEPEWIEWIGWQQTIGDFRKYWRTKVSLKDTYILVPGEGGGIFRQDFVISKLPREESRPYTEVHTLKTTYIDGAPIHGRKPARVQVSSEQNSVEVDEDKERFTWEFGALNRNQFNRSYLMVRDGDLTFPAYHEVFKGYPRELSTRISGILSSDEDNKVSLIVVGELAFNYWFENLLGWTNYYTRQRLGLSMKAFRTLTELKLGKFSGNLNSETADLKYRFNPGLWARDESWGVMAGYHHVSYDFFDAQFLGAGFFWARSMPKVFDDLLSTLPFMNYPKWVDFDFVYYMSSMDPGVGLAPRGVGNWALNFHGQVMFTDSFFGEAGFGLKQYDFSQKDPRDRRTKGLSFISSYGTVGCGLRF